ncbi:MAG: hypothetical protein J7K94_07260 [Dehalococcoidia bacterium]|nr:hypothetical protein [Dehalococcoidia bacterium]
MGKRDFSKRETKKTKKGLKKTKAISELLPQPEVEIIKKHRKSSEESGEE